MLCIIIYDNIMSDNSKAPDFSFLLGQTRCLLWKHLVWPISSCFLFVYVSMWQCELRFLMRLCCNQGEIKLGCIMSVEGTFERRSNPLFFTEDGKSLTAESLRTMFIHCPTPTLLYNIPTKTICFRTKGKTWQILKCSFYPVGNVVLKSDIPL